MPVSQEIQGNRALVRSKSSNDNSSRDSKIDDLDETARAIMDILKRGRIKHIFIGGYAASLLGGARVTQDVDVVVEKSCSDLLLTDSRFRRSLDGRIQYKIHGRAVSIDVHLSETKMGAFCTFPRIIPCNMFDLNAVVLKGRPVLSSDSMKVPILQPTYLLFLKLLPWYEAKIATRQEATLRTETDMDDITSILSWLVKKKLMLNWRKFSDLEVKNLLCLLGVAYRAELPLRSYIPHVLNANYMMKARQYSQEHDNGKFVLRE